MINYIGIFCCDYFYLRELNVQLFSVLQHPCNSSVQYSVTDEPPQLSSNMPLEKTGDGSEPIVTNLGTTNASLSSGNNDPPEADRLTYSEAQQSVCLSLQRELERLQKYKDENIKLHDDMVCQSRFLCFISVFFIVNAIPEKFSCLL